ncbi:hypothetical protein [Ligilactobacillus ruminis]|uniref:Uncharacterized protein n=2 Tax=Ligilactobacillus ruminis TaxID=1623 RepID=F7QZH1_9LACO|nr:hypothetical protein LRU_00827 [Ligilactobacillus ruminis SPM0211]RGK44427.1 hypothetical protein DXD09_10200 [Ligilactobacillus ruminis]
MRAWRADLASTAFGKIIAVYGHINGNGRFVRKRPALKKAITDKCSKNSLLFVNPHHNGQKFTDKSAKNGTLSVNLDEILDRLVEQHCI